MDVVSWCCCKEVYRYPHNNYYSSLYSPLVLALFLAAAFLLCSFLKCFLFLEKQFKKRHHLRPGQRRSLMLVTSNPLVFSAIHIIIVKYEQQKFDAKSRKCIMLGSFIKTKAYRLYDIE